MQAPLFVRPLTDQERQRLRAGLRSPNAFTLRRCQALLASADRQTTTAIARLFGCAAASVRNAIHAFEADGLACLTARSSRPKSARPFLDEARAGDLRGLLHQSPRSFGAGHSTWTLPLAAEACHARGWTPRRLSGEAVRLAIKRLGISWRRAKAWITSPDPAYARKKSPGTA